MPKVPVVRGTLSATFFELLESPQHSAWIRFAIVENALWAECRFWGKKRRPAFRTSTSSVESTSTSPARRDRDAVGPVWARCPDGRAFVSRSAELRSFSELSPAGATYERLAWKAGLAEFFPRKVTEIREPSSARANPGAPGRHCPSARQVAWPPQESMSGSRPLIDVSAQKSRHAQLATPQ